MATMTRFEPLRHVGGLHDEVERLFLDAFGSPSARPATAGAWAPALDVAEDGEQFTLFVDLPGVDPDSVDITLEENVLTFSGERAWHEDRSQDDFRRVERRFGAFHRAVRLPDRVDGERVTASYEHGVLTVVVPKAEDAKPRRIAITASS